NAPFCGEAETYREQQSLLRRLISSTTTITSSFSVAYTTDSEDKYLKTAWKELKPKLILLLESHRESRLKARRTDRYNRLSNIFSDLRTQVSPLVSFEIYEYGDPKLPWSRSVTQEAAFPELVDALQWPLVKSMLDADATADELEQKFNSHREEIDTLVLEWKNKFHKQMLDTIPKVEGDILRPTLVIGSSNPFKDLSDETKLLLRADSLFLMSGSTQALTYGDILRFTITDSYSLFSLGISKPERPLDIEKISNFPLARGIAQELLKNMGCPDASYLELKGNWICGRCTDTKSRTWTQIVEHYVQEKLHHFTVSSDVRRMNITYHNVHDPELFTDQPMVRYLSSQLLADKMSQARSGQFRQCKICAQSTIRKDVRGPEGEVLKHLLDVHEIRQPEFQEHYRDPAPVTEYDDFIGFNFHDLEDTQDMLDDEGNNVEDEYVMYDTGGYDMFDEEEDYD
ncbi:unnamed protein product, partial [Rhizoctonia solani]